MLWAFPSGNNFILPLLLFAYADRCNSLTPAPVQTTWSSLALSGATSCMLQEELSVDGVVWRYTCDACECQAEFLTFFHPYRRRGQQRSWPCSCAPLTHTLTGIRCGGQLQQRWTSSLVELRSYRGGRQAVLRRWQPHQLQCQVRHAVQCTLDNNQRCSSRLGQAATVLG